MAVRTRVCWLAILVLMCWLALTTHTAEAHLTFAQSSVHVVPGTLPEAKIFARQRQRAGEWQFDFDAGDDENFFFDDELSAMRQWREWKQHVRSLRAYRQQREREAAAAAAAHDGAADAGDNTPNNNKAGYGADEKDGVGALDKYFTERQVQRRMQSRNAKQASFNKTSVEGQQGALGAVQADVAALWDRLKGAGTSLSTTDQAYLGLVERHFPHTYREANEFSRAKEASPVAANGSPTAPPSYLFLPSLLSTPILLEAEVVPLVEKEVRHLRALWERRSDSAEAAVRAEVENQLSALAALVNTSRSAALHAVALADPLADAAASWVATTLVSTTDGIRSNDESTEAKRAELKQLVKQRSRLQKAKQLLDRHVTVYKGVLHRQQLPNAEATLFALALLAQQRLGDEVTGTLEVLPSLSTTAPLTGLLEAEWVTHVLRPFALCLCITAAFLWLAEEGKEWCLRRVQASKRRLAVGGRSPRVGAPSSTGRIRKLFLFACLLEAVVPPLLPLLVLTLHLRGVATEWTVGVAQLMRPSQRVVCVVAMLALLAVNYVWGLVVRRLFHLIDPSVYRRRHAKTK